MTKDLLVEGVHFTFDRISWRDLGFRAAAVNLSDLAASGAVAEALVVGAALPGDTELDDVLELYAGIAETGVPVVGGDTSAAARVTISVTAIGRSPLVPGRGGAGRATFSSSPGRSAPRAQRFATDALPGRRSGSTRAGARRARARAARHLGRAGGRRRSHRRAVGLPRRRRARPRAARARRDGRRPRVRRGLRAARRGRGARPARGDRSLRGGRGRDAPPRRLAVRAPPGWEHFR